MDIGDGKIINSDFLNNLTVSNAKNKIVAEIEKIGKKNYLQIKKIGEFLDKGIGDVQFL